jgi:hypothetical protein
MKLPCKIPSNNSFTANGGVVIDPDQTGTRRLSRMAELTDR